MTTDTRNPQDPSHPSSPRTGWWQGVGIIVGLELRQRMRTTRWKLTLAAVFVVMSIGVFGTLYFATAGEFGSYEHWAIDLFGILVLVLLFFGVVLAPTLTATAINGDRKDATLAVVQATPVTNWQLAVGKLVGTWLACLALVVIALPYLVWGIVEAPYGLGPCLLALVVLAVLYACFGAIGLGFSALIARPAGSALMTQATVFLLVLGLPMLFAMLIPATAQQHEVMASDYGYTEGEDADPDESGPEFTCKDVPMEWTFEHTQSIWWLLAPNPVLLLADVVAPHEQPVVEGQFLGSPPESIAVPTAELLSWARSGDLVGAPTCKDDDTVVAVDGGVEDGGAGGETFYERREAFEGRFVGRNWYIGLLIDLALGAIGLVVAARGLRVPVRTLPKGVRIA